MLMSDKGGPIQSRDDNPTRKKPLETLEEVFFETRSEGVRKEALGRFCQVVAFERIRSVTSIVPLSLSIRSLVL